MVTMKEIPWKYFENMLFQSWNWETEHFIAQIRTSEMRFSYSITNKQNGRSVPVDNGIAKSFEDAESSILSFIGKAYPLKHGYRKYAGHHATTFRIYTGELVDFGTMEGQNAIVKFTNREQNVQSHRGLLQIRNFDIVITTDSGRRLSIPPANIISAEPESYTKTVHRVGSGRAVRGGKSRGCTGTPGFQAGIIDHLPSAPWCPIHKI